jgi:hypothetical protein
MRIGLVVDGQSEVAALPKMFRRLEQETGHQFLRPLLAPIQPLAPPAAIARTCSNRITQLTVRGAERILVLLDRETREECPGVFASQIEGALALGSIETYVVVKNRTFENWLISDLGALLQQPARFSVTNAMRQRVAPDRADHVEDAFRMLRHAAQGASYSKVADSQRILGFATPTAIALNSRSFRRFLRCSEHPSYVEQSRTA